MPVTFYRLLLITHFTVSDAVLFCFARSRLRDDNVVGAPFRLIGPVAGHGYGEEIHRFTSD